MTTTIKRNLTCLCIIAALAAIQGCGKYNFLGKKATPLRIEEVEPPIDPETPGSPGTPEKPGGGKIILKPVDGLHPIFSAPLGTPIPAYAMGVVDADPNGFTATEDWDGDGVLNDLEVMSSPMVADYPRVVTRVTTPITMELRKSEIITKENYTEMIDSSDTKQTISNSMENKHYTQMNKKTTPYVTKESQSTDNANAYSYGASSSMEVDYSVTMAVPIIGALDVESGSVGTSMSTKTSSSQNKSFSAKFAQSTMSEKTVFQDVDYVDNLDRNGIELKDETIQNMATNYRKSEKTKDSYDVGPNAGYVRAGLYIKNDTVNMPVRISNVICTLSFRTAGGAILPVKTFRLRNDDYSAFEQEIYGGEELGPYTIEIPGLNTFEVKQALANGYMPQITVVSYDMDRVEDSNYNPGVDNLKIVENTAKARTALIKIIGTNTREIYRVAAFDVEEDGTISPGISLKKALFNIYADKIGKGETWESDKNSRVLTVPDTGLKWKEGFVSDPASSGDYAYSTNKRGNSWRLFETYVKSYVDENNTVRKIETIKRIGPMTAYNPFDILDNTSYNPNEFLEREELLKMKYWIILHNGRYFEGDINDPIWAGERYEIVCMDIRDFNEYFKAFSFTPVQSREYFSINTRWNSLSNEGEFARAKYLGRLVKSDVVHLEINLSESRFLFEGIETSREPVGIFSAVNLESGGKANQWYGFNYTLQKGDPEPEGIPGQFSHYAEGGFNNIKVTINESRNAREYEIKIKVKGAEDRTAKTVRVTADELRANNNEVFINRETTGVNGEKIGFIEGKLLSSGGLEYVVNVTAMGKLHGVDVSTPSMLNSSGAIVNDETVALVYNVASGTEPGGAGGFTFSAAGMADNTVYVRIGDANYTEYFNITVVGPYNYDYNGLKSPLNDETAPSRNFTAHRGLNRIKLDNPAGEVRDDGVYKVFVKGYNNNNFTENPLMPRAASNEFAYVTLSYDRYAAQRVCKPRLSTGLFKINAIDLEVNFNDGNGWYRLKLDPGDAGDREQVEDKRVIDCRFNSYVDYDTQRFHIFFKPPTGVYDEYSRLFAGNHDVFAGGREAVDVYIRTPAETKYRDTFWLKNQGAELFSEELNYIVMPTTVNPIVGAVTPNVFLADYWTKSDMTDASNVEHTLSSKKVPSGSLFYDDLEIGFKDSGLQNYFFSPVEYRNYEIRASLVENLPQQQNYVVDPPRFFASGGAGQIDVVNIESQFATYYEVYYKLVNPSHDQSEPLIARDENPLNWESVRIDEGEHINWLGLRDITIPINSTNQYYIIAVIGYNMYGRSEAAYFDGYDGITMAGDTDNRGKVASVFVYSNQTPPVPVFTADVNVANDRQIVVNNVHASGALRYIIQWKESQEGWSDASSYDTYAGGEMVTGACNYTITQHRGRPLKAWKTYNIRAQVVTLNGNGGEYSAQANVTTGTVADFGSPLLNLVNTDCTTWWGSTCHSNLFLSGLTVPEGTSRYTVTGVFDQYITNGLTIERTFTFEINSNSEMIYPGLLTSGRGPIVGDAFNGHTMWINARFTVTAYSEGDQRSSSRYYDLRWDAPAE
ncbi:MAG TPA: hypothetical protein PKX40_20105 [Spirochaetota bacterium]|nr:hypothetical protein [Spirochaetota bacterium]